LKEKEERPKSTEYSVTMDEVEPEANNIYGFEEKSSIISTNQQPHKHTLAFDTISDWDQKKSPVKPFILAKPPLIDPVKSSNPLKI